MRTKSLLCGCIVLLLMFVTTATPSLADNTIYGCVRRLTGILRIVSPPGQCLNGETPISWNNIVVVRGDVAADGSILAGTGFTVQHTIPGLYRITFDTPFTSVPICMISRYQWTEFPGARPRPWQCTIHNETDWKSELLMGCDYWPNVFVDTNNNTVEQSTVGIVPGEFDFSFLCVQ